MKQLSMMSAGLVLLGSAPSVLAASETVGPIPSIQQGLVTGVMAILVFFIALIVLAKTVWPKIDAGLAERENKIRTEIAAAEDARQQAKDALNQYEKSLAQAHAESKKMLEDTKAQQQKLAAELREKADMELTAMKDRARRDIESAREAAISDLYAEATNLSMIVASKVLGRQITSEDHQRLIEESLSELQSLGT